MPGDEIQIGPFVAVPFRIGHSIPDAMGIGRYTLQPARMRLSRHARSAVGVYRLPMNFAVEVDAVVQVR